MQYKHFADMTRCCVCWQVVEQKASRTPGKKSLAIEAYARALRAIPGTICDNAGEPGFRMLL